MFQGFAGFKVEGKSEIEWRLKSPWGCAVCLEIAGALRFAQGDTEN
jgi:hypothetical protein